MRSIFTIAILIPLVFAGPVPDVTEDESIEINVPYLLVEKSEGEYIIEDLETTRVETRASRSDITYHFYTQSNPNNPIDLKNTDVANLRNTPFNPENKCLFIVHGWTNHHLSPVNLHIREAVLQHNNINVFVVDWSPISNRNYITARNAVVNLGQYVGEFIESISLLYRVPLNRVALVGHSLGAHISGNAGMHLNGRVDHIIGLDPAGPLFTVGNINNRLDRTDAQYVQVIHTNSLLGFTTASGHADYYPNGGKSQPGCGIDLAGSCAHNRAFMYYAESVNNNRFVSRQCSSYSDFTSRRCDSNPISRMGGFGTGNDRASGIYYLTTNRGEPYALG